MTLDKSFHLFIHVGNVPQVIYTSFVSEEWKRKRKLKKILKDKIIECEIGSWSKEAKSKTLES